MAAACCRQGAWGRALRGAAAGGMGCGEPEPAALRRCVTRHAHPCPPALFLRSLCARTVQRVGAPAFKVGQISGLASAGDGTVWVLHRGERAWNPDGSVANSGAAASGSMEEEGVLQGPVVLQVGGQAARGVHVQREGARDWERAALRERVLLGSSTNRLPCCSRAAAARRWIRTAAHCCAPGAAASL